MDVDGKAKLLAHRCQLPHAGRRAVSKAEVLSFVHAFHAESCNQDPLREPTRRQTGQLPVESEQKHCVDPRFSQQPQPLRHRRNQLGRLRGTQKLLGVRIEGNRDGPRARLPRLGRNGVKNLAMPLMYAVKVAHSRYRGTKPRRDLIERTKHSKRTTTLRRLVCGGNSLRDHSVTGRLNPSYASLTFAGSVRLVSS